MSRIVKFIRGLPASGKSTLSKKILQDNADFVRVNKDEIRLMMDVNSTKMAQIFDTQILRRMMYMDNKRTGEMDKFAEIVHDVLVKAFEDKDTYEKFLKAKKAKSFGPKEKWIIKIQTIILKTIVSARKNIIVDDTNYNPEHLARIKDICQFYTLDLIDMHRDHGVTLEQCIERNKNRQAKVPEIAIYSMNTKYGVISKAKDKNNKPFVSSGKYCIFDLDGTLCDIDHRKHFVDGSLGKKDWKAFFDAMDKDSVRENTKQLIDLTYPNHEIVIVTGRPSNYREITEKWLKDNNVRYNALYMRSESDRRPDNIVKQEILDNYLDKSKITMVVDDRKIVLEMWRSNGLPTINVGGDDNDF